MSSRTFISYVLFSIFVSLLFNGTPLKAQKRLTERKVSLTVQQQPLEKALLLIGKNANFQFSYNVDIIPVDSLVSFKVVDTKVKKLLREILPKGIITRISGDHLILLKRKQKKVPPQSSKYSTGENKSYYIVTGHIYDARSGLGLDEASIYQVGKMNAALSNSRGRFELKVSEQEEYLGLGFSKENFQDTIIVIKPSDKPIDIFLRRKIETVENLEKQVVQEKSQLAPVENIPIVQFFVPDDQFKQARNRSVLEKRFIQLSLVPGVGTNLNSGGLADNRISLNLIAGYSGGASGLEVGGVLNIVRQNLVGTQIAGFGNIVGGSSKGLQIAGFSNHNRGEVNGVQIAGFSNSITSTLTGIQVAGFSNFLKGEMKGTQLAGFSNVSLEKVDGIQVAGFSNVSKDDVEKYQIAGFSNVALGKVNGIQFAGFSNYAQKDVEKAQVSAFSNVSSGDVGGAQVSGFSNVSRGEIGGVQLSFGSNVASGDVGGAQIAGINNIASGNVKGLQLSLLSNFSSGNVGGSQVAGFFNFGNKIEQAQISGLINVSGGEYAGAQISGFLNIGRKIKGAQIGAFNFADSVGGPMVGLFSYSNNGYHLLEFSSSPLFLSNLTFKTGGSRGFYNIITLANHSEKQVERWAIGYGLGLRQQLNRTLSLNQDLIAYQILEEEEWFPDMNTMYRFNLSLGIRINRTFTLAIGPNLNLQISRWRDPETGESLSQLAPYTLREFTYRDTDFRLWLGGQAALRIQW
ncbi:hypothetical protein [Xanthovirga aplysinae]|uniref:hypothetical protein n=1 Tax=Xanthovirga aplysinae TaxID=2529853 RepID=UPI0012BC2795|nr:hypothetical protein [Xanthovirga aplysinae]MTI32558.1 hypothetical protein [Xanthovirga aplysinae]